MPVEYYIIAVEQQPGATIRETNIFLRSAIQQAMQARQTVPIKTVRCRHAIADKDRIHPYRLVSTPTKAT